ncbi:unnamed protein product [Urochloa humidicola]
MRGTSPPRPSLHLLICGLLLLVLLVSSPHSSEARTSPDVYLAASTPLQYGTRKLLGTDNPITSSPPAPVSGPPIGPGLVITPPPSV